MLGEGNAEGQNIKPTKESGENFKDFSLGLEVFTTASSKVLWNTPIESLHRFDKFFKGLYITGSYLEHRSNEAELINVLPKVLIDSKIEFEFYNTISKTTPKGNWVAFFISACELADKIMDISAKINEIDDFRHYNHYKQSIALKQIYNTKDAETIANIYLEILGLQTQDFMALHLQHQLSCIHGIATGADITKKTIKELGYKSYEVVLNKLDDTFLQYENFLKEKASLNRLLPQLSIGINAYKSIRELKLISFGELMKLESMANQQLLLAGVDPISNQPVTYEILLDSEKHRAISGLHKSLEDLDNLLEMNKFLGSAPFKSLDNPTFYYNPLLMEQVPSESNKMPFQSDIPDLSSSTLLTAGDNHHLTFRSIEFNPEHFQGAPLINPNNFISEQNKIGFRISSKNPKGYDVDINVDLSGFDEIITHWGNYWLSRSYRLLDRAEKRPKADKFRETINSYIKHYQDSNYDISVIHKMLDFIKGERPKFVTQYEKNPQKYSKHEYEVGVWKASSGEDFCNEVIQKDTYIKQLYSTSDDMSACSLKTFLNNKNEVDMEHEVASAVYINKLYSENEKILKSDFPDVDAIINNCDEALTYGPEVAVFYLQKGMVLADNNPEAARAAFNKAIEFEADNPVAYLNLIDLLIEDGAFLEAHIVHQRIPRAAQERITEALGEDYFAALGYSLKRLLYDNAILENTDSSVENIKQHLLDDNIIGPDDLNNIEIENLISEKFSHGELTDVKAIISDNPQHPLAQYYSDYITKVETLQHISNVRQLGEDCVSLVDKGAQWLISFKGKTALENYQKTSESIILSYRIANNLIMLTNDLGIDPKNIFFSYESLVVNLIQLTGHSTGIDGLKTIGVISADGLTIASAVNNIIKYPAYISLYLSNIALSLAHMANPAVDLIESKSLTIALNAISTDPVVISYTWGSAAYSITNNVLYFIGHESLDKFIESSILGSSIGFLINPITIPIYAYLTVANIIYKYQKSQLFLLNEVYNSEAEHIRESFKNIIKLLDKNEFVDALNKLQSSLSEFDNAKVDLSQYIKFFQRTYPEIISREFAQDLKLLISKINENNIPNTQKALRKLMVDFAYNQQNNEEKYSLFGVQIDDFFESNDRNNELKFLLEMKEITHKKENNYANKYKEKLFELWRNNKYSAEAGRLIIEMDSRDQFQAYETTRFLDSSLYLFNRLMLYLFDQKKHKETLKYLNHATNILNIFLDYKSLHHSHILAKIAEQHKNIEGTLQLNEPFTWSLNQHDLLHINLYDTLADDKKASLALSKNVLYLMEQVFNAKQLNIVFDSAILFLNSINIALTPLKLAQSPFEAIPILLNTIYDSSRDSSRLGRWFKELNMSLPESTTKSLNLISENAQNNSSISWYTLIGSLYAVTQFGLKLTVKDYDDFIDKTMSKFIRIITGPLFLINYLMFCFSYRLWGESSSRYFKHFDYIINALTSNHEFNNKIISLENEFDMIWKERDKLESCLDPKNSLKGKHKRLKKLEQKYSQLELEGHSISVGVRELLWYVLPRCIASEKNRRDTIKFEMHNINFHKIPKIKKEIAENSLLLEQYGNLEFMKINLESLKLTLSVKKKQKDDLKLNQKKHITYIQKIRKLPIYILNMWAAYCLWILLSELYSTLRHTDSSNSNIHDDLKEKYSTFYTNDDEMMTSSANRANPLELIKLPFNIVKFQLDGMLSIYNSISKMLFEDYQNSPSIEQTSLVSYNPNQNFREMKQIKIELNDTEEIHPDTRQPIFTYQAYQQHGEKWFHIGSLKTHAHEPICHAREESIWHQPHNIVSVEGIFENHNLELIAKNFDMICEINQPTEYSICFDAIHKGFQFGAMSASANLVTYFMTPSEAPSNISKTLAFITGKGVFYTLYGITRLNEHYATETEQGNADWQNSMYTAAGKALQDVGVTALTEVGLLLAQTFLAISAEIAKNKAKKTDSIKYDITGQCLELSSKTLSLGMFAINALTSGKSIPGQVCQFAASSVTNCAMSFFGKHIIDAKKNRNQNEKHCTTQLSNH